MARKKLPASVWHPRYYFTWITVWLLRAVTYLPFDWQLKIGSAFGQLAYRFASSRREIATTNIQLCFPEKSPKDQTELVKNALINSGIGIFETNYAWTRDISSISQRFEISGLEHLQLAVDENKPVLLMGMHFSTLDLCGAVLNASQPFHVMYRRNKNPVLEKVMSEGRRRNFPDAIERSNIRAVIKALKQKHIVWYGPDQDYGRKQSVFAPFFGIPAASITATARIAKMTDAEVIPFCHRRLEGNQYEITIGKPLDHFPSGDDEIDALTVNQTVEAAILDAPDQYWWVHRRFKTRPEGEVRPY
jgi:KDO2-lipid IV(A) lauroyltransferase